MKRLLLAAIGLLALLLGGCYHRDPFIPLDYVSREIYGTPAPFMDWTFYEKYRYEPGSRRLFADNLCYTPVGEGDLTKLRAVVDDFADWAYGIEYIGDAWDFDPACMGEGDYFLLNDWRPEHEHYVLYYFDAETDLLYVFDNKW